ncbi:MAG: FKBP-type peptidyl-prolyl cis-trans isomerase [Lentisphaerales bacterium]|nr:FKBP-type peptidyl-prolyl cis-trans isomerase [Lentisphaerales bacterium]
MEAVEKECVVGIEYVIADTEGNVLDSSQKEIMHFVHGSGTLPAAVEEKLIGQKVDDMVKIELSTAEAYGEYDSSLVFEVGPEVFEEGLEIFEGMMFQRQTESGLQFARVTKINGNKMTADANHPLAGKDLLWHVVVVGIRPATYQEILNKAPNLSGHPCGEETASQCEVKDSCQSYCGK